MTRSGRPAEGSWTEHYAKLGTGPVSFRDSTSEEFYELEREAIFKRANWPAGLIERCLLEYCRTNRITTAVAFLAATTEYATRPPRRVEERNARPVARSASTSARLSRSRAWSSAAASGGA